MDGERPDSHVPADLRKMRCGRRRDCVGAAERLDRTGERWNGECYGTGAIAEAETARKRRRAGDERMSARTTLAVLSTCVWKGRTQESDYRLAASTMSLVTNM